MNNPRLASLTVCIALLLAGCGGSAQPESVATTGADAEGAAEPASTLVSAVSSGKAGAAVDLKFDIAQRPRVGESLPVSIVVKTLAADISKLQVIFQSTDGIRVVDGLELNAPANPASGQTFSHTVIVLPQKDGVSYLSAVALVEGGAGSSSIARTFAIPIIVGDVVAAEAALAEAADAGVVQGPGGERVVPLPADESGKR